MNAANSPEHSIRWAGYRFKPLVLGDFQAAADSKAKPIAGTAESVAQDLAASDWRRLSAGDGTKGPRLHDWAYVELADIDASDYGESRSGLWTRGVLIRRTIADQDLALEPLRQESAYLTRRAGEAGQCM